MFGNKPIEALPGTYSNGLPLADKIKFVLSLLKKAGADEIAMEIIELQGIASEQGVADVTVEVAEELQRLVRDGRVSIMTGPGKKLLYNMKAKQNKIAFTFHKLKTGTMAHNQMFQSCIDACLRCASICNHCATACLQEDDVKMLARCIQLDIECAAICYSAAQIMSMNGQSSEEICRICADICSACGEECEKHARHMDHCRECAEACRQCAEECRRMVGASA